MQNAKLIYQRDQPKVNIFDIKKSSANTIWQNISYTTSFADSKDKLSSNSSIDDACLFGNDGFSFDDPSSTWNVYYIDPSVIQDPYSSCNDPFAGMWGYEDSGLGGEQETCEQCRKRNHTVCESQSEEVYLTIAGPANAAAFIGCMFLIEAPPLFLACAIGAGLIIDITAFSAARARYVGCMADRCPMCES